MRITGGKARGIPLKVPPGLQVRPATDGMREAVFSSLGTDWLRGARVLDLFAGSGAYGLEAFSRGADSVIFVEMNSAATKALSQNRAAVARSVTLPESEIEARLRLDRRDAFRWQPPPPLVFSLIFADPPYALLEKDAGALLKRVCAWLASPGLLLLEAPGGLALPETPGLQLEKVLGKGVHQPSVRIFSAS